MGQGPVVMVYSVGESIMKLLLRASVRTAAKDRSNTADTTPAVVPAGRDFVPICRVPTEPRVRLSDVAAARIWSAALTSERSGESLWEVTLALGVVRTRE
ncbi:hypothetical protein B7R21_18845 [Subtercola boreus]|uniref:Uncharacterized protein n=1 Tax=Subtercola boreus TaxID=120213 RepID=A0A3E0VB50_9MICO|nr:hypothetical protein B7R21_18845 [Subtercola boreus]